MRRGLGPDSEYFIAFLPLALLIPVYFILRALLTGHWHRTRIKPLFEGRYAHLMQRKYWVFWLFRLPYLGNHEERVAFLHFGYCSNFAQSRPADSSRRSNELEIQAINSDVVFYASLDHKIVVNFLFQHHPWHAEWVHQIAITYDQDRMICLTLLIEAINSS